MTTFRLGRFTVARVGYGAMPTVVRVARRYQAMPAQVALSWLLGLSPNVLLIPGTASLQQLSENLAAAHISLDHDAMDELDADFA